MVDLYLWHQHFNDSAEDTARVVRIPRFSWTTTTPMGADDSACRDEGAAQHSSSFGRGGP
ncbi:hypothetical protein GCM10027090_40290 [Sinomonas soli]